MSAPVERPSVTVLCVVYNHAPYLRQCLEGILAQRTNFPFEVVIHDDASTDGSSDIARGYERRHPGLVRCVVQPVNRYSQDRFLTRALAPLVRGEFAALCEGDDYWTHPDKLRLQREMLVADSSLCGCFTTVDWLDDSTGQIVPSLQLPKLRQARTTLGDLLLLGNVPPTPSLMVRSANVASAMDVDLGTAAEDYLVNLHHAKHGDFALIDQVMAVYRSHAGGAFGSRTTLSRLRWSLDSLEHSARVLGLRSHPCYRPALRHRLEQLAGCLFHHRHYGQAFACFLRYITLAPPAEGFRFLMRVPRALARRAAAQTGG